MKKGKERATHFSWKEVICLLFLGYSIKDWIITVSNDNLYISLALLFNFALLLIISQGKKQRLIKYYLLSFFILLFLQIRTTNIKNTYSFTPFQIDQQIQRMNYYPPKHAKLGYIMETKYQVKYAEIAISNLIETLDFNTYFPDYFPLFTLPLFFYGMYLFFLDLQTKMNHPIKNAVHYSLFTIHDFLLYPSVALCAGGFSVFCLMLVGLHGKYGPFLIFPFVVLFIYIGTEKILHYLSFRT